MLYLSISSASTISVIIVIVSAVAGSLLVLLANFVHAQQELVGGFKVPVDEGDPVIKDTKFEVDLIAKDLEFPTAFAFVGLDDILVLEKEKGSVKRIVDGETLPEPLINVNVASLNERGLLGIAVSQNASADRTYVFLYYTEAEDEQADDNDDEAANEEKTPLGNRLYRYELVDNKLINPKLLLDLPATPGPSHNGGAVTIGPDGHVYLVIGDVRGSKSLMQNFQGGAEPDGRGGILRVTQDGELVNGKGILGDGHPLDSYYAYGIRNSFGIDFDPVTNMLWDTEVGNKEGDEINLVKPGFNSGYSKVQGLASQVKEFNTTDLVDFNRNGIYSDPQLTWNYPVTPTGIKFLNSDRLGKQYTNDIFVGGFNNGKVYHFDLNDQRNELSLNAVLQDHVAGSEDELDHSIFAENFGGITDIEVGPDGYLYVMSFYQGKNEGTIFRIVPSTILSK
jgi:aldose sugar dehydrogenase